MLVEVRNCSYAEVAGDPAFPRLIAAYADESGIDGLPRPTPDTEHYLAADRCGLQHMIGAYHRGNLVGFANVLVAPFPHYSTKIATIESWFVHREYRYTGAGLALKRAAERTAKEAGAAGLFISTPFGSQLAAVMSAQSSYRETNRVFFKAFA